MRVIQMGMGGMGNAWLERLTPLPFVDYVGFVEINQEIAEQQAKIYQIDSNIIFKNLPDALNTIEADAVLSIIPPQFRTETLQTCIDFNIPLMAEKPLAETLEDACLQAKMAEESGLVYVITQDYRYKPNLYTIKQILESGKLGELSSVTVSHYRGLEFVGFRSKLPFPLLNDMAVHHFDLLRYFTGAEPTSIYAKSWSPSWNQLDGKMSAFALIDFPNDVHVSYASSWVSNGLVTSYDGEWRFECSKGSLTYINDRITIQMRDGMDEIRYTYHPAEHPDIIERDYDRQGYLAYELDQYIQTGKRPQTVVQDNVKTLQMVFDAIESSKTGQIITKE